MGLYTGCTGRFLEITAYGECVNGMGMSDFQFSAMDITVTDYSF
ncbi:hypothetical protein EDWATA_00098 [Edwardsiella tarda ATCC 23685]|uniref:Uncharacterized protein n=1 Tax=Edwardsiella tarda ATCC 23685 TaxID=500638 RepID=D4F075_EDWTA|nr:hypothetical protein EDWATA_00098 [Edwardsiella tarda ATCC 23685]